MGLEDKQSSNAIYLNVVAGKVAQRLKEHIEDGQGNRISVERKTKDKDNNEITVIERHHTGIGGIVQKAEVNKGKFGLEIIMEIRDDKLYHLTIPLKSSYGRGVLYRIPNIDSSKFFTIRPYSFINDDGDKKVGVVVIQEGMGFEDDKVPPYWTKSDPKGLPEIVVTEGLEGEKEYNDTERRKYLVNTFNDWASKIGGIPQSEEELEKALEETAQEVAQPTDDNSNEVDDLPF
mgnify:CR=1 FL=1